MKNVLIVGANSAIAKSTAKLYAEKKDNLYLFAQNSQNLEKNRSDLEIRTGCAADIYGLDIYQLAKLKSDINDLFQRPGGVDIALVSYGSLPDQNACEFDNEKIEKELYVNGLSTIKICNIIAKLMLDQGHGKLGVITSVAADRGRKSNYVYGSAKALVDTYLEGLRARLDNCGVGIITIKPGFVDTPMTKDFKKGFLWVSPDYVARKIVLAFEKNKDVVYVPWVWFFIMLIIKNIPAIIMKKLPL